jgi:hypothetical protein
MWRASIARDPARIGVCDLFGSPNRQEPHRRLAIDYGPRFHTRGVEIDDRDEPLVAGPVESDDACGSRFRAVLLRGWTVMVPYRACALTWPDCPSTPTALRISAALNGSSG